MRLAAGLLTVLTGCSSAGDPATGDSGVSTCSFACIDATADAPLVQKVGGILSGCAGDDCHNHGSGNLWISGANDFTSLMDARSWEMPSLYRVQPGDPVQSYVYRKVACEGGIDGACMPLLHPDPAIAQIFHDWIEAGAPLPQ